MLRLSDYLEQHGRNTRRALCPPSSFWAAGYTHLTHPDDLNNLANEARNRCRLQWAHHLARRAADAGNTEALDLLAAMREQAGDHTGAEALYRQAANAGKISFRSKERWPYGLDPDGTPTLPWSVAEDAT